MRSPATASARMGTGPRALSRTIPCKSKKAMASFGVITISVCTVVKPLPLVLSTLLQFGGGRIGARRDFSLAGDLGLLGQIEVDSLSFFHGYSICFAIFSVTSWPS